MPTTDDRLASTIDVLIAQEKERLKGTNEATSGEQFSTDAAQPPDDTTESVVTTPLPRVIRNYGQECLERLDQLVAAQMAANGLNERLVAALDRNTSAYKAFAKALGQTSEPPAATPPPPAPPAPVRFSGVGEFDLPDHMQAHATPVVEPVDVSAPPLDVLPPLEDVDDGIDLPEFVQPQPATVPSEVATDAAPSSDEVAPPSPDTPAAASAAVVEVPGDLSLEDRISREVEAFVGMADLKGRQVCQDELMDHIMSTLPQAGELKYSQLREAIRCGIEAAIREKG